MKKYFYLKDGQQIGPFSYDELWNQKIAPNTQVWYEGMREWQRADTFPEFANWFPKQNVTQKRPQQTVRRPQQRLVQQRPAKRKKSYRGIIGVAIFLIGAVIIYVYWTQNTSAPVDQTTVAQKNTKTKKKKSKKSDIQVQVPGIASTDNFTKESFPLNPNQMGNEIASFLGLARTSFSQAKLIYMHPNAEDRFQYIIDTYSETSIKMLLQGVVPSIKYQSLTSALVVLYNPWNDLVLLTEWQLFQGEIFITDIELVTADFLKYDGQSIGQLAPLWARTPEEMPIESLVKSLEQREELFDEIWGELTGTGAWREVLYSLSSIELLVNNQAVVAFRLRDQYLGTQYLLRDNEMEILREPFISAMKKLHSGNGISELLNQGPQTPDIVRKNFAIFPAETWEKAALQVIQKVPEGAFVFVTTPKLTKTFLSFYYKFNSEEKLILNRIDWCTFDNEI